MAPRGPGTLEQSLAKRRANNLVGRQEETAVFDAVLGAPEPAFLWVHAPGGAGKSTLLRHWADRAQQRGLSGVLVDLSVVEPAPAPILALLDAQPQGEDRRLALFFDGYENGGAVDAWVRDTLVPSLPDDVVVVLASREPPPAAWKADAALGALVRPIALAPLDAAASLSLLRSRGAPEARLEELARLGAGHPLALVLLSEAGARGAGDLVDSWRDVPSALVELSRRLLGSRYSERERRALALAAHARTTTEELLRAVLGEPGPGEDDFAFLARLPFATLQAEGVRLHAIVRTAVDDELRWRNPAAYRELHLAVFDHLVKRVTEPREGERERRFLDLLHLRHVNRTVRQYVDFDGLGGGWAEAARPDDWNEVAKLVAQHEGPAAVDLARRWWERQPGAFTVVRAPLGTPVVVSLHLALTAAELQGADDPVLAAVRPLIDERGGLRAGQRVVLSRLACGQEPASDGRLRHYRPLLLWLTTPNLAYAVTAMSGGARWLPALEQIGHARWGAFQTPRGRDEPIIGCSFQAQAPAAWLRRVMERDLDEGSAPPLPAAPGALDRPAALAALKDALKHLHSDDRLAHNPLLGHRLALSESGCATPASLRRALLEQVNVLRAQPREQKLVAALDAAFLRPAPSQELAAERLGIPFSTFRRHLSKAIARLEELLWHAARSR